MRIALNMAGPKSAILRQPVAHDLRGHLSAVVGSDVLGLWFMPVYGYLIIGGFGTFAVYLPELFPTRVRASGQGFCWNAARCLTAVGPLVGGVLVGTFGSFPAAAASTTVFYAVGMIAIWFGPETKGIPLSD